MNPITECKRCSDCAIRLGFGFTQPDVLICTVRGDEVGPGDGCTLGSVLANAGQSRVWADRITLPVGKCPERLICAVSSDGCGRHDSLRYSQLTTLHLQAPTASSLNVLAGTKLILWGED